MAPGWEVGSDVEMQHPADADRFPERPSLPGAAAGVWWGASPSTTSDTCPSPSWARWSMSGCRKTGRGLGARALPPRPRTASARRPRRGPSSQGQAGALVVGSVALPEVAAVARDVVGVPGRQGAQAERQSTAPPRRGRRRPGRRRPPAPGKGRPPTAKIWLGLTFASEGARDPVHVPPRRGGRRRAPGNRAAKLALARRSGCSAQRSDQRVAAMCSALIHSACTLDGLAPGACVHTWPSVMASIQVSCTPATPAWIRPSRSHPDVEARAPAVSRRGWLRRRRGASARRPGRQGPAGRRDRRRAHRGPRRRTTARRRRR